MYTLMNKTTGECIGRYNSITSAMIGRLDLPKSVRNNFRAVKI